MNNYKFLLVSILISAPVYCKKMPFSAAQQEVGGCQGRVNDLEAKIKAKDKEIERLQARLSRIAGNAEYAKDIDRHNGMIRTAIQQREQLGSQLGSAVGELKQKIAQVGRRHYIGGKEGRFHVVPHDQIEMPQVQPAKIRTSGSY